MNRATEWIVDSCLKRVEELLEVKEGHETVGDKDGVLKTEEQIAQQLRVVIDVHGPMEEEMQKAGPVIRGFKRETYRKTG